MQKIHNFSGNLGIIKKSAVYIRNFKRITYAGKTTSFNGSTFTVLETKVW